MERIIVFLPSGERHRERKVALPLFRGPQERRAKASDQELLWLWRGSLLVPSAALQPLTLHFLPRLHLQFGHLLLSHAPQPLPEADSTQLPPCRHPLKLLQNFLCLHSFPNVNKKHEALLAFISTLGCLRKDDNNNWRVDTWDKEVCGEELSWLRILGGCPTNPAEGRAGHEGKGSLKLGNISTQFSASLRRHTSSNRRMASSSKSSIPPTNTTRWACSTCLSSVLHKSPPMLWGQYEHWIKLYLTNHAQKN